MAIRQYLTYNADQIIQNNQQAAIGNCNSIILLSDRGSLSSIPILFTSLFNQISFYDMSDLKIDFLKYMRTFQSI